MRYPFAFAALVIVSNSFAFGQNSSLEARFREEAPIKWAELLEIAKGYSGSSEHQSFDNKGEVRKLDQRFTTEWKSYGEHTLWHMRTYKTVDGPVRSERVMASNPYYLFQLSKQKPKEIWLLDDMVLDPQKGENVTVGNPPGKVRGCYHALLGCLQLCNTMFPDILTDKQYDFQFTGKAEVDSRNPYFVRIPMKFLVVAKSKRFTDYMRGVVVFDSSRYWVIVDYEMDISDTPDFLNSAHQSASCMYQSDMEIPIVSSRKTTQLIPQQSGEPARKVEESTTYTIAKNGKLDESLFRLSAYGIPEPLGVPEPPSNRIYIWIVVAGLSCIGLSLFVSRFLRRRNEAKKSPSAIPVS